MRAQVVVVAAMFLLLAVTAVQGYSYEPGKNAEPAFLHDIGPQDDRADNPAAAAVTAIVVAAVFYRGFRKYNTADRGAAEAG